MLINFFMIYFKSEYYCAQNKSVKCEYMVLEMNLLPNCDYSSTKCYCNDIDLEFDSGTYLHEAVAKIKNISKYLSYIKDLEIKVDNIKRRLIFQNHKFLKMRI